MKRANFTGLSCANNICECCALNLSRIKFNDSQFFETFVFYTVGSSIFWVNETQFCDFGPKPLVVVDQFHLTSTVGI